MSESDIGRVLLAIGTIIATTQLLGYAFNRLNQPRLIGEILAGVVFGSFVIGKLAPTVFDSLFNLQADKSSLNKKVGLASAVLTQYLYTIKNSLNSQYLNRTLC